jgi:hypothetical protein
MHAGKYAALASADLRTADRLLAELTQAQQQQ